jgi:hypothetical protein
MVDSSDLLGDQEALRKRYAEDGYLKFSGLLPKKRVLGIRKLYFDLFNFKSDGCPSHGTPGHPAFSFVRSEVFDSFAKPEEMFQISEALLQIDSVVPLKRRPLRHFKKGHAASRAHADLSYVDQGTKDVVTFWVPIGDCLADTGSLTYLEGSHKIGIDKLRQTMSDRTDSPNDKRRLSHDLQALAERTGRKWLVSDFEAGDVVCHSPYIIHASLDCRTDEPRLSTDLRFVRLGDEIDPRWLKDWRADDGY